MHSVQFRHHVGDVLGAKPALAGSDPVNDAADVLEIGHDNLSLEESK